MENKRYKVGEKNPTDINFASIGNQIQFLDSIKYFQQSLGALADSLTDKEKSPISKECEKGTKILCEIFEQRSRLQEIFKFNPRKCNSVSSFSSCVHRDKSKCYIALTVILESTVETTWILVS